MKGRWVRVDDAPVPAENGVVLADGRAFVFGDGREARGAIFDPSNRTWSVSPAASRPHTSAALTRLADGRVLVSGGTDLSNGYDVLSVVEVFDPESATWSLAAPMPIAVRQHTQSLLPDGRVLVIGGAGDLSRAGGSRRVMIFDPTENTWAEAGQLVVGRYFHHSILIEGDRVLVFGGYDRTSGTQLSVELCDLTPADCTVVGQIPEVHSEATPVVTRTADDSVTLFSPQMSEYSIGTHSVSRIVGIDGPPYSVATALPDGTILCTGGTEAGDQVTFAQRYIPAERRWEPLPPLSHPRRHHVVLVLPDDTVLVTGGLRRVPPPVHEEHVLATELWVSGTPAMAR